MTAMFSHIVPYRYKGEVDLSSLHFSWYARGSYYDAKGSKEEYATSASRRRKGQNLPKRENCVIHRNREVDLLID